MVIRLARREDVPAILDISNWAATNTAANFAIEPETLHSWTESFDKTHAMYPWVVGEADDNQIMGFAKAGPHKGRCAYAFTAETSVYVHPAHFGKGIGTSLYRQLIPLLKEQGYITLLAGITTPNTASERLHAAFGFKLVGTFERVGWKFNRWHNVSYYESLISSAATPPKQIISVVEAWQRLSNKPISARADASSLVSPT
jgi:phosphinothricin acetyltransferase